MRLSWVVSIVLWWTPGGCLTDEKMKNFSIRSLKFPFFYFPLSERAKLNNFTKVFCFFYYIFTLLAREIYWLLSWCWYFVLYIPPCRLLHFPMFLLTFSRKVFRREENRKSKLFSVCNVFFLDFKALVCLWLSRTSVPTFSFAFAASSLWSASPYKRNWLHDYHKSTAWKKQTQKSFSFHWR